MLIYFLAKYFISGNSWNVLSTNYKKLNDQLVIKMNSVIVDNRDKEGVLTFRSNKLLAVEQVGSDNGRYDDLHLLALGSNLGQRL